MQHFTWINSATNCPCLAYTMHTGNSRSCLLSVHLLLTVAGVKEGFESVILYFRYQAIPKCIKNKILYAVFGTHFFKLYYRCIVKFDLDKSFCIFSSISPDFVRFWNCSSLFLQDYLHVVVFPFVFNIIVRGCYRSPCYIWSDI